NSKVVIFQKNTAVEKLLASYKVQPFCWSFDPSENALHIKKSVSTSQTVLQFTYKNQPFEVNIPFTDYASTENAINAMMVLLYLGYDSHTVESRMKMLYPIEMRLKVKNGINNTTLIDDSYISD